MIKCLKFVVHMIVNHRWYLFCFLLKKFYVVVIILYRQRMGQCLNDLSFQDLQSLESDMESAWRVIHDRADRVLTNQIETSKKKARNVEQINRKLQMELEAMDQDPYGLVDNGGDYNSVLGF